MTRLSLVDIDAVGKNVEVAVDGEISSVDIALVVDTLTLDDLHACIVIPTV